MRSMSSAPSIQPGFESTVNSSSISVANGWAVTGLQGPAGPPGQPGVADLGSSRYKDQRVRQARTEAPARVLRSPNWQRSMVQTVDWMQTRSMVCHQMVMRTDTDTGTSGRLTATNIRLPAGGQVQFEGPGGFVTAVNAGNKNLSAVNAVVINDPGPLEGIIWDGTRRRSLSHRRMKATTTARCVW